MGKLRKHVRIHAHQLLVTVVAYINTRSHLSSVARVRSLVSVHKPVHSFLTYKIVHTCAPPFAQRRL